MKKPIIVAALVVLVVVTLAIALVSAYRQVWPTTEILDAGDAPESMHYADEFAELLLSARLGARGGWETNRPLSDLFTYFNDASKDLISPNGALILGQYPLDQAYGYHEIILVQAANQATETVLILQEGDPGSGPSHTYEWSSDSKAVFIAGRGKLSGHPRVVDLALIYLVDKKTLYRIDLMPYLVNRIERVRNSQSEPLTIVPGVGIGPVTLGMPIEDVAKVLGSPDRGPKWGYGRYVYSSLGLVIRPARDNSVGMIFIGNPAAMWLVEAVKSSTEEGIGMMSTPAEVVAAYGQPEKWTDGGGGREELTYDSGRTIYMFKEGRLVSITLKQ